jgi:hypothetical protein
LVAGFGGVPSGAAAVVVNVTVVSPSAPGYVTVYPAGQAPPTASSLNYVAGQTVPNQVTVKLGTAGAIVLFASGGCPNLVVDVQGWFAAGPAGTGGFEGVTPARVRDTRLVGGCLVGNESRSITVGGVGAVPSSANAVVLNVTAVTPTAGGYLTVYPTGRPTPLASSLNFAAGGVVPNAVTVELGTGDSIAVFNGSGGCTHVVVDVVGYYAGSGDPVTGGFVGITPTKRARQQFGRVSHGCTFAAAMAARIAWRIWLPRKCAATFVIGGSPQCAKTPASTASSLNSRASIARTSLGGCAIKGSHVHDYLGPDRAA